VAYLNLRFGLTEMTLWRIEVAPVPDLSNVATPTKAIITIPITLYGYGNGDDAEEGGAEPCVDERVSPHNLHPFMGRHTSDLGGFQDTQNTVENAHPRPP
jgi:hypothetical protein